MLSPEPVAFLLSGGDRALLARVARESLVAAVGRRSAGLPAVPGDSPVVRPGCSFVTLERNGRLRGCIGSLTPRRPLVEDVASNARSAALDDFRFPPVEPHELTEVEIEISVLSPTEPLAAASEADLLAALRPGVDGLLLEDGPRRATFLPSVWEQLPDRRDFLTQLRRKAGLAPDHWTPTLRFERYQVESFAAGRALGG